MHTFEQSYKDFINSLKYAHEETIWIFDDTLPSDPWSALPVQSKSYKYREMSDIAGRPWHGDVFKTIFAIHDLHPEFSYVTHINHGNPQTILWKKRNLPLRAPVIRNMSNFQSLSYFDLIDMAWVLLPQNIEIAIDLIGQDIDPESFKPNIEINKIIRKIKTLKQIELMKK